MGDFLELVLEKMVGHRCRIETTDGTIRYEQVHSIGYKEFKCPLATSDNGCVRYPVVLYYDEREAEGVELSILASIEIDEPKGVGVR
jgi:hypothetical protein